MPKKLRDIGFVAFAIVLIWLVFGTNIMAIEVDARAAYAVLAIVLLVSFAEVGWLWRRKR